MKTTFFIIQVLLILLGTFFLSKIFPWWIFTAVCFLSGIAVFTKLNFTSFWAGFIGIGIYYFSYCFFLASTDNFIFSDKIGHILGSSADISLDGSTLLWIGTGLFSILGGLFALSGTLIAEGFSGRNARFKKIKSLKLDLK